MAQIHPERTAQSLKRAEIKRLHQAIQEVLTEAILGQEQPPRLRTGYGRRFQNRLQIYGKKGVKCPRCGVDLEHKKVAGVPVIVPRLSEGVRDDWTYGRYCQREKYRRRRLRLLGAVVLNGPIVP